VGRKKGDPSHRPEQAEPSEKWWNKSVQEDLRERGKELGRKNAVLSG